MRERGRPICGRPFSVGAIVHAINQRHRTNPQATRHNSPARRTKAAATGVMPRLYVGHMGGNEAVLFPSGLCSHVTLFPSSRLAGWGAAPTPPPPWPDWCGAASGVNEKARSKRCELLDRCFRFCFYRNICGSGWQCRTFTNRHAGGTNGKRFFAAISTYVRSANGTDDQHQQRRYTIFIRLSSIRRLH